MCSEIKNSDMMYIISKTDSFNNIYISQILLKQEYLQFKIILRLVLIHEDMFLHVNE